MSHSVPPAGAPDRRPRLLVVDGDLSAVFTLRHFFALAGYDVDCTAGPTEALRLLHRNSYDAVITDLHLSPGGHGEGMAVAARARHFNRSACIVVLMESDAVLGYADARRTGVDIYHRKPVDLAGLMSRVARVLATPRLASAADPAGPLQAPGSIEDA